MKQKLITVCSYICRKNLLALSVLLLVGTVLGYHLFERILYELQGPLNADSTLYLGVGRGILNGLIPYIDLFETKPPGVFLLSSLSLWLTKGTMLISVLQIISIAIIPISLLLIARNISKNNNKNLGLLSQVITVLLGLVWALYMGERSGEFQVESFGSMFATLYLVTITLDDKKHMSVRRTVTAGLLLMCAIGMKEPFVLTALASVLLIYATSPSRIIDRFVKPCALAAVLGFFALSVLRYLGPFLSIYLPEMLGNHIHSHGPLWQRALNWQKLFYNLEQFIPFLGFSTLVFFGCVFCTRLMDTQLRTFPIAIISMVVAIVLTVLSVGLGGQYWNHHFAFAVPVYIAASALFVTGIPKMWPHMQRISLMACIAVLISFSLHIPESHLESRLVSIQKNIAKTKDAASDIDDILLACKQPRYMFIGANGMQPYAFTEHSPLGPNFFQYNYFFTEDRPYFRQSFVQNLFTANIVVINQRYELGALTPAVERDSFSTQPWKCAQKSDMPDKYQILFRKRKRIALTQSKNELISIAHAQ